MPTSSQGSGLTRRDVLAAAGTATAALMFDSRDLRAQAPNRAIVFRNTTVVNADTVQEDVSLAAVQFWNRNLRVVNPASDGSLEAHGADHAPATASYEDRERTASSQQKGKSPRVPRARRPRPGANQH